MIEPTPEITKPPATQRKRSLDRSVGNKKRTRAPKSRASPPAASTPAWARGATIANQDCSTVRPRSAHTSMAMANPTVQNQTVLPGEPWGGLPSGETVTRGASWLDGRRQFEVLVDRASLLTRTSTVSI